MPIVIGEVETTLVDGKRRIRVRPRGQRRVVTLPPGKGEAHRGWVEVPEDLLRAARLPRCRDEVWDLQCVVFEIDEEVRRRGLPEDVEGLIAELLAISARLADRTSRAQRALDQVTFTIDKLRALAEAGPEGQPLRAVLPGHRRDS